MGHYPQTYDDVEAFADTIDFKDQSNSLFLDYPSKLIDSLSSQEYKNFRDEMLGHLDKFLSNIIPNSIIVENQFISEKIEPPAQFMTLLPSTAWLKAIYDMRILIREAISLKNLSQEEVAGLSLTEYPFIVSNKRHVDEYGASHYFFERLSKIHAPAHITISDAMSQDDYDFLTNYMIEWILLKESIVKAVEVRLLSQNSPIKDLPLHDKLRFLLNKVFAS